MKILILAPHPFYQERGTPIAVDLLIRALSERGDSVDLLTYQEGVDREYDRLRIHRIKPVPAVSNLRPGFSAKKLYSDVFMFFRFVSMMWSGKYDVVHAVEESAFMALLICPLHSTPFVYDIDSSMTTQLVDKYFFLRPFRSALGFIESLPMRYAEAVVPMCDSLASEARRYRDKNILVLKDASLLGQTQDSEPVTNIREDLSLQRKVIMYIGNLEPYQGIKLLLESFRLALKTDPDVSLVIIGGVENDISEYRGIAERTGIGDQVHFLGPRPVARIGQYMSQADVLVSPRTQGTNTPMKVYSYLDSGVAVLATRLPTHTQVMDDDIAMLAAPEKEVFSRAMVELLSNNELRRRLADNAKEYVKREHSYATFKERIHKLYAQLEKDGS